jgi:uncharacterized protein YehS (DUF1456 family)
MSNNDILKKLRVALKLKNDDIQKILLLANFNVSISELNAFFRNEDHPNYKECGDQILRNFLIITPFRKCFPGGIDVHVYTTKTTT